MSPASFPAVMPRAMPEAIMDSVRWLTYAEMAEALGIGRESARVLTQRKRWPRRTGNDGKARIGVPEEEIATRNDPLNDARSDARNAAPNDPPDDTRNAAPPSELVELRVLNARLEAQIEALKVIAAAEREQTERERQGERERSERERQLLEKAVEEARAERDRWAAQAEQVITTVDPLKSTIEALKAALDAERCRLSEFREERDRWRTAATARRSWWPWRRSA
jgi:hypothetical protein